MADEPEQELRQDYLRRRQVPARTNEPTHVSSGDVFEDLGFSPEDAAVLRLKTKLHMEIMEVVEKKKLSPRELAKQLDVQQPQVSELMTGKISKMSVDKLTKYLYRLGRDVEVKTKKTAKLQGTEVA